MTNRRSMSKRRVPPPPAKRGENSPGLGSTIMGNIFTGMTFGAGSSLGHRAVDGVMGNREVEIKQPEIKQDSGVSCEKILDIYQLCLKENNNCEYLENMIKSKCS